MKKHLILLCLATQFLWTCNSGTLINEFHDLPETGWEYEYIVKDSFEVQKPHYYHLISANLRIEGDYIFSNIHLKMDIIDPDGETSSYNVPILLAEKSGKWLGSGLGDVLTYQTPILHRKVLNKKGKYMVTIAQDMRLQNLANVHSIGLKVEQEEEIY